MARNVGPLISEDQKDNISNDNNQRRPDFQNGWSLMDYINADAKSCSRWCLESNQEMVWHWLGALKYCRSDCSWKQKAADTLQAELLAVLTVLNWVIRRGFENILAITYN